MTTNGQNGGVHITSGAPPGYPDKSAALERARADIATLRSAIVRACAILDAAKFDILGSTPGSKDV